MPTNGVVSAVVILATETAQVRIKLCVNFVTLLDAVARAGDQASLLTGDTVNTPAAKSLPYWPI